MTIGARFSGVGTALVTPMQPDGSVDFARLAEHVEFQISGGVDFLVPCGTTGESATLSAEEQDAVISEVVAVAAGRVLVMAGAASNHTAFAETRVRRAVELGADGILSLSPYYNKPTQEGIVRHFTAIAEAARVPVFIYNVPGRTSSNILPETVLRLAEVEHIAGVKEASGSMEQAMHILRDRPKDFMVLSGEDALTVPMIALGADGAIAVVSNEVPNSFSTLVHAALEGDFRTASEHHMRLLALMNANFVETNPIPVKTALGWMGRLEPHMRLPLTPLSESRHQTLRDALESAGVEL